MKNHKAVIIGCSGPTLTSREAAIFSKHKPLGFILFARNIKTPEQTKKLIQDLRDSIDCPDAPVLVDQEGGKVARLKQPFWQEHPDNGVFEELYRDDLDAAMQCVYDKHKKIAEDLCEVGFSVNCAPVLDLAVKGASQVIGHRAFSHDPGIVSTLGKAAIQGLRDGHIIPIIKHIPGHGPAKCDSHKKLPYVRLSLDELQKHFLPFSNNADSPWAMTAHIVYEALDKKNSATHSFQVIEEIIRKELKFNGFLVSDDLGMKALKGTWENKVLYSFEAGCDAVLHCSGIEEEMVSILNATPIMTESALRRLEASFRWVKNGRGVC